MNNYCGCNPPPIGPTLAEVCGGSRYLLFLGILETFLRRQCDISDPCRQIISIASPDAEYDFIIVGGGTAGSVVAARLSENRSHRVLLIEAGGNEPLGLQVPAVLLAYQGSAVDWGFVSEPSDCAYLGQPCRRVGWARGKMLGGSSALNAQLYFRGNREDYDGWQQSGNPGWSYREVLPYFKKSESHSDLAHADLEYHGFDGPMMVSGATEISPLSADYLRAGEEFGLRVADLNAANATGIMVRESFTRNGVRMSAAKAYLRPHLGRRNLHILLNTEVTKVLLRRGTNRAYAVRAIREPQSDATEQLLIRARKEIIVCAGNEQTPKLLMLSGIGPADELQRWNIEPRVIAPGVGRNLQNHVGVFIQLKSAIHPPTQMNWAVASEYLLQRSGPMSLDGYAVNMKMASRYAADPNVPDMQIQFSDTFVLKDVVCARSAEVRDGPDSLHLWVVPLLLKPRSRGQIRLRSADPLDPPLIYSNELGDEADVETLLDIVNTAFEVLGASVFDAYNLTIVRQGSGLEDGACGHWPVTTDDYWRCMIRYDTVQFFHAVGTCRMGPAEDEETVVDHQLNVHGVSGLRVADASVMPQIVAGNPAATVVMIGEKAADMIATEWMHRR